MVVEDLLDFFGDRRSKILGGEFGVVGEEFGGFAAAAAGGDTEREEEEDEDDNCANEDADDDP